MKYNGSEALLVEKRGFFDPDNDFGYDRIFVRFTDAEGRLIEGTIFEDDTYGYLSLHPDLEEGSTRYDPAYHHRVFAQDYSYSEKGLLDYINALSDKHYEKIVYTYSFDCLVKKGRNYTPDSLIYEIFGMSNYRFDGTQNVLTTPFGKYKYMAIPDELKRPSIADDDYDIVTVIMEDVEGEGLRYQ